MSDVIYRIELWRFGNFPIEAFEVAKRTSKTVVVKMYNNPNRMSDGYREWRYHLKSGDYIFFDTLKEAKHATENIVANRMQVSIARTAELRKRLQEVCKHKNIDMPSERCCRCDYRVPNPEDYCDGGS